MFVKIANSYVHDDSAAEDIVNECFIRMWEKRATLNTENYESYAFKSIINRCLDYLKVENNRTRIHKNFYETGSRMRTYEINSLNSLDPEHLFADEINTLVDNCLKRMPDVRERCFLPAALMRRHMERFLKSMESRCVKSHHISNSLSGHYAILSKTTSL